MHYSGEFPSGGEEEEEEEKYGQLRR